jgi:hypothetical protein
MASFQPSLCVVAINWPNDPEDIMENIYEITKIERGQGKQFFVSLEIKSKLLGKFDFVVGPTAESIDEIPKIIRDLLFNFGEEIRTATHPDSKK